MSIIKQASRRVMTGIIVLWGAATLTFIAMITTSGDIALIILGGEEAMPTPEILEQVRREYRLDQPIPVQYWHYILNLASGDFGESWRLRVPVTDVIKSQIGATAQLALWAGLFSILSAITLAILTARRANWIRSLSSGTELFISSIPSYVIGILLLVVFAFHLQVLPGVGSDGWRTLVLPVISMALPTAAVLTQVLRQELEDVLEQPFVVMARARGLSETGVRLKHALRHTMIPLITLSGFIFASLLGGAVLVEMIFARQGVGRLMLDAANSKDMPMLLAITLLAAATYVLINFIVDILIGFIDPRGERSVAR